MSSKNKCPRCKTLVKKGAIFCPSCGEPLGNKEKEKEELKEENTTLNEKETEEVIEEKIENKDEIKEEPKKEENEDNTDDELNLWDLENTGEFEKDIFKETEIKKEEPKEEESKETVEDKEEDEIDIDSQDDFGIASIKTSEKDIGSIIFFGVVITVLLLFLVYFIFIKDNKKCEVCKHCPDIDEEIKVIEKEPTVQYINYKGYRFAMPLDWKFSDNSGEYKFTNESKNIYVTMKDLDDVTYESFIKEEYLKTYIEKLQTEEDLTIKKHEEKLDEGTYYYVLDGSKSSYPYTIIAVEKENGVILIETQYINNMSYNSKKEEVAKFATSYKKSISEDKS